MRSALTEAQSPSHPFPPLFGRLWGQVIYPIQFSDKVDTIELPVLHHYAFKYPDGRRGLIVVNYDLAASHSLTLRLPGKEAPRPAMRLTLVSDGLFANNEPESPEPGVRIVEESLDAFGDGSVIVVPPCSMVGFVW